MASALVTESAPLGSEVFSFCGIKIRRVELSHVMKMMGWLAENARGEISAEVFELGGKPVTEFTLTAKRNKTYTIRVLFELVEDAIKFKLLWDNQEEPNDY